MIPIRNTGYMGLEDDLYCTNMCQELGRLDWNREILLAPELQPLFKEGNTVIDVGAYIGDTTVMFCDRNMTVFAFEARVDAYECLHYNLSKFENTYLFNVPVGLGENQLAVPEPDVPTNPGGRLMRPVQAVDGQADDSMSDAMQTFALDTLLNLNSFKGCEFIKIDVEGFEPFVLQGAKELIKKYKPAMFIEMNNPGLRKNGYDHIAVLNMLREMGYRYRNAQTDRGPDDKFPWDVIALHGR